MKRLIFTLFVAILSLSAVAQESKRLMDIDPTTFRPVQTDVLTGVGVDSIEVDRSKRPCARIKMRINRMTPEEIGQIEVRAVGGNVEITRRDLSYEGNGLIIEMTAKQPTRFYLHHNTYGDSNEVSLNLEGDKEYYIEAQLNQLYTITVVSNKSDADVYLDDRYCKKTNDQFVLIVHDVTPGEHRLRIEHAGCTAEQKILVHRDNVYFRCNVDTPEARPQFVVIEVEPKHAMVFIDNEPQTTQEGYVQAVLQNGTYTYRVMAKGYLEQSGQFTVAGEKVHFPVRLTADAAQVTITAGSDAEIWVNNERKGPSPWKGVLLSGSYIFEARKAGHRTTVLAQVITSSPSVQNYTLDAPQPIKGSMTITSVPAMADIYLNGEKIGQTPLMKDLVVGNYNVELRRQGYTPKSQTVVVAEGKNATLNLQLTKIVQQSSEASSAKAVKAVSIEGDLTTTCGPYKVGDLFHENGLQGVVIQVATDGMSGKIVSIPHATSLEYALGGSEYKRVLGAVDTKNGANNFAKVKKRPNWQKNYPAFAWCAQLGEEWYLPAIEELKLFTTDDTTRRVVSKTLKANGAKGISSEKEYLSSTEANGYTHGGERFAKGVVFYYKNQNESTPSYRVFQPGTGKRDRHSVRAVAHFTADPAAKFVVEHRMKKCRIEYRSESKVKIGGYGDSKCEFGAKMISHEFENGKGIITFNSYVTQIGDNAFGCSSITEITIPETVTSIGNSAFWATKLESITIPNRLVSIGKSVFERCKQLKEFKGPNATPDGKALIVNNVLVRVAAQGMTSYAIPEGVTEIAGYAFGEAKGLKKLIAPSTLPVVDLAGFEYDNLWVVEIPEGVTHLKNGSFSHDKLINVTIPESVVSISRKTFWGMKKLSNVYCKPTTPPQGDDKMFHYWTEYGKSKPIGCKIYVPKASLKAYKSAPYWSNYKGSIKPMK